MCRPCRVALSALALVVLVSCGSGESAPVELRLAELVRFADRYHGEVVATTGVVHTFDQPEHFWIQDDRMNRVLVEPQSAIAGLVGRRVRVVGRFEHDAETGRRIEAETVVVVE